MKFNKLPVSRPISHQHENPVLTSVEAVHLALLEHHTSTVY